MNETREREARASEELRKASAQVLRSAKEACGFCLPHRAGGKLVIVLLGKVLDGIADPFDLKNLKTLAHTMSRLSRCPQGRECGSLLSKCLGDHSNECEILVREDEGGVKRGFDIEKALGDARRITGRESFGGNNG